ncbi:MAG: hypothetical protein ACRDT0_14395 [Pseudonocardiaceae bacterium]
MNRDATADLVVEAVQARGALVARIDTAGFPATARSTSSVTPDGCWWFLDLVITGRTRAMDRPFKILKLIL